MSSIFKPEVSKTDRNTGKKVKIKTKKWYGRYRDESGKERRVPLSENKATAQQMLAERVKQIERIKSGQMHSAEFEMKKPIAGHLADYEKHLKSKICSEHHILTTIPRVQRFIKESRCRTPAQITASEVERFLAALRDESHYSRSNQQSFGQLKNRLVICAVSIFAEQKHRFRFFALVALDCFSTAIFQISYNDYVVVVNYCAHPLYDENTY